jgi:transcriptional regulator with XRE-family HTH domain
MSNIWARIREERERLGLSQEAFGALGGVKKLAQFNYEKGKRSPTGDYFEQLRQHNGIDVNYIVTGIRTAERKRAVSSLEYQFDDLGRAFSTALGLTENDLLLACADVHKAIKGLSPDERNFDDTFPEYARQVRSEYVKAAELLLAQSPKLVGQLSSAKDINFALLSKIIEGIEQALAHLRKSISPDKKTTAIVMLYRMGVASDQVDQKMIEDAVKLAASG